MAKSEPDTNPQDCPTAWFCMLERAKLDNDFEGAAEAIRELRRLGVEVRFLPEKRRRTPEVVPC